MGFNTKIIEFWIILGHTSILGNPPNDPEKPLPQAEAQIWSESQKQVEKVLRANENEVGHSIQWELCPQVSSSHSQIEKWWKYKLEEQKSRSCSVIWRCSHMFQFVPSCLLQMMSYSPQIGQCHIWPHSTERLDHIWPIFQLIHIYKTCVVYYMCLHSTILHIYIYICIFIHTYTHTYIHACMHYIALHCVALRCIALHCVALRCIALRCVALRYIMLYNYISWSCPRLPSHRQFVSQVEAAETSCAAKEVAAAAEAGQLKPDL